jgi:hypothetical protein
LLLQGNLIYYFPVKSKVFFLAPPLLILKRGNPGELPLKYPVSNCQFGAFFTYPLRLPRTHDIIYILPLSLYTVIYAHLSGAQVFCSLGNVRDAAVYNVKFIGVGDKTMLEDFLLKSRILIEINQLVGLTLVD